MKKLHDEFEAYLTSTGSRYTTQKREIVTEILKMTTHFEVEDFIIKVHKKNKKISRATVYRTIKHLLDAGLVQKINANDGRVLYEPCPQKEHHDHIICNVCGKIFEIKEDLIKKILDEYCDSIGFDPQYRSLHIYGECHSHK